MTWFNKLPFFIQSVAQKIGYTPSLPETLCNWDDLKCHYDKLKPVFDICKDNACLLQNLVEYGAKYDKSFIYREFTRNYLPYVAVSALATSIVIGFTIRQCAKRAGKKKKL